MYNNFILKVHLKFIAYALNMFKLYIKKLSVITSL